MPHALVAQRMQHAYAALASAWPLRLIFSTLFNPYEYCSFCLTGRLPDKAHLVHRHAIPILEIKYVDWTYPVRPMSEHWSRHCGPCLFMSTTTQNAAHVLFATNAMSAIKRLAQHNVTRRESLGYHSDLTQRWLSCIEKCECRLRSCTLIPTHAHTYTHTRKHICSDARE